MSKSPERLVSARLRGLSGWAALTLVIVGTLTGFATFLLLTGATPIKPTSELTYDLLLANSVLVILMLIMIGAQMLHLLLERRRGTAGTGLHIRLISLFSIIALVPAILVAVFATVTLNRGLDTWFSDRTRAIVDTASTVADAYLTNASEATRTDTANIAADLVQQLSDFNNDRPTILNGLHVMWHFVTSQRLMFLMVQQNRYKPTLLLTKESSSSLRRLKRSRKPTKANWSFCNQVAEATWFVLS